MATRHLAPQTKMTRHIYFVHEKNKNKKQKKGKRNVPGLSRGVHADKAGTPHHPFGEAK